MRTLASPHFCHLNSAASSRSSGSSFACARRRTIRLAPGNNPIALLRFVLTAAQVGREQTQAAFFGSSRAKGPRPRRQRQRRAITPRPSLLSGRKVRGLVSRRTARVYCEPTPMFAEPRRRSQLPWRIRRRLTLAKAHTIYVPTCYCQRHRLAGAPRLEVVSHCAVPFTMLGPEFLSAWPALMEASQVHIQQAAHWSSGANYYCHRLSHDWPRHPLATL